MRDFWNAFSQQMKPRLHEISAYLIAFSFCWLLAFHPEFRWGFFMFFTGFGSLSPVFITLGLFITGGLLLSLAHVFINRKKSAIEKFLIGWFVLGTSSLVSFVLGSEMLSSQSSIMIILPVWNILMSILLLFQNVSNRYELLDDDATPLQVFLTTIILVAILLSSDFLFHFSWALILSFCIFYSTSIIFLIAWILSRFGVQLSGTRNRENL
jgi:hypothetical protein